MHDNWLACPRIVEPMPFGGDVTREGADNHAIAAAEPAAAVDVAYNRCGRLAKARAGIVRCNGV
jgi:hypothetical protein